ncbi:MAG TPA: glycosyltransferase family 39 protein [Chthoniobacterales bacterium]|jgi:4-amino-4-deoxy-L-arabinose transferase-like glycosyltransferase|nr:glycosyltransferase family 39 protein [Chthoniobacterales bacterium]
MTKELLGSKRAFWTLAALMLVLFSVTNLPWELDGYDQAKQAWTSYEMVTEGHWFYQRTSDDQGLATKPPLTGWISATIYEITRSWDVAWRLPSLICAGLIAFLLLRSASRGYGNIAGLIAFAAFGFNLLSPRLATLVRSDMPLALVIFLVGLLIWEKIRDQQPWSTRDRWIMFGLLTAGMLIKGPIIYAFLLPGIVVAALYERRVGGKESSVVTDRRYSTRLWFGWWPWLASLAIFLVWVIAGCLWVPRFYELVVVREFLARFGEIGPHVHRSQSIFFYLAHLLHKFFPWSALIIGLAIFDLRARGWNVRRVFEEMSPATIWLACWIIGGLVLMSLIPSKRVDRIFPVIPPLCLLVAVQIAHFINREKEAARNARLIGATLLIAVLFSAGYVASRMLDGYRERREALSTFGRQVREEAAKNHWRYEAIGKSDEGLPLYLTRPHFLKPDVAVEKWNKGEIDALAVPVDQAPDLMRELHDSTRRFESATRQNLKRPNYVLLTR